MPYNAPYSSSLQTTVRSYEPAFQIDIHEYIVFSMAVAHANHIFEPKISFRDIRIGTGTFPHAPGPFDYWQLRNSSLLASLLSIEPTLYVNEFPWSYLLSSW